MVHHKNHTKLWTYVNGSFEDFFTRVALILGIKHGIRGKIIKPG